MLKLLRYYVSINKVQFISLNQLYKEFTSSNTLIKMSIILT